MKNFLILSLFTLIAVGCSRDELPVPDTGCVRLTLDLQTQEQAVLTRAVDENALTDFNLFIYRQGETFPTEHVYTSKPYSVIELVPGNYDFRVVANLHKDLGDLKKADLDGYTDYDSEDAETLVMIGRTEQSIDFSTHILTIELRRKVAKIGYNITLAQRAIEAGIVLTSVQLCNQPDEIGLFDAGDRISSAARFHDSEMRTLGESSIATNGVFYMLPNPQGTVPDIVSQADKNRRNAPEHASYLRIRGKKGNGKIIDWNVYLGANNTDDFNVRSNEAHTYDITIHSDGGTDTRITSWVFECTDNWPHIYNSPADTGLFRYTIENTSEHRLTGLFRVIQGDNGKVAITNRSDGHNVYPPYNFEASGYGEFSLTYAPELVKRGVNSRLEYRAEVTDETGETADYTFVREFANRVQVFNPSGADIGVLNVTGALDRQTASDRIIAWCYEDGCTLTATVGAGQTFDGWYADAGYTHKLSESAEFRYVPSQSESSVYAKLLQPKTDISYRETVKNSTYMFNTNNVDVTVENYSGTIVVKVVCADGGVVVEGAEQTKTVTAGRTITLDPIKFAPVKAGEVTYTIQVYTADGRILGTKDVTNTITATKLTPKIRVYYDDKVFGGTYEVFDPDRIQYNWYKYNRVLVDVSFSPKLDYPAQLPETSFVQVAIRPSSIETRSGGIHMPSEDYDNYELERVRDDDGNEYIIGENTYFGWTRSVIERSSKEIFQLRYASAERPQTACLFDINSEFPLRFEGFGAHSQNLGTGEVSKFCSDMDPSTACNTHLVGHPFIYCFFNNDITAEELDVTPLYQGSDLQIETNLNRIEFINNVHSK